MPVYDKNEFEKCSICDKRFAKGEKFILITTSLWRYGTTCNEQMKKDELKIKMYRLDWIKILQEAIDMRPSSWYPLGFEPRIFVMPDLKTHEETKKYSPAEWRNASDEVCGAVIRAMEKEGLLKPLFAKRGKK
jgi:hypothetical protein